MDPKRTKLREVSVPEWKGSHPGAIDCPCAACRGAIKASTFRIEQKWRKRKGREEWPTQSANSYLAVPIFLPLKVIDPKEKRIGI